MSCAFGITPTPNPSEPVMSSADLGAVIADATGGPVTAGGTASAGGGGGGGGGAGGSWANAGNELSNRPNTARAVVRTAYGGRILVIASSPVVGGRGGGPLRTPSPPFNEDD